MNTNRLASRRRFFATAGTPSLLALMLGGVLTVLASTGVAAVTLEEARFSALPGNEIAIDLVFSGPVPERRDFATDNPARIAIDFPGTSSALERGELPIQLGAAQSLTAIQAGERTRVVINLNDAVPYELRPEGNRLRVALNPPPPEPQPSVAMPPPAPVPGPVTPAPTVSRFAPATRPVPRQSLSNVDFRRGADGSGRVLINLPSAQTRVNVREQAGNVFVDIADTQLPQRLLRRLDVVDFATPVLAIESRPQGGDIEVRIETKDQPYDYLAYQSDGLLTVEFRALTPAEREQLERERVVFEGDRLSLNFQDIEVRAVLQLLADHTGMNLVASDAVRGNITLRLQNVPWDQALDIVLKTKGLSMRRTGNVIMVAPTQDIAAQERLELESLQQVQELAPLRSEFMQVNYAKAADLAALIKSQDNNLLSERGNITIDARTNTLLVQDTSARLEDIRRLVMRLDIPVRQVMIESRVVIADNSFARELGVRFGLTGSVGSTGGNELLVGGGRPGHLPGTSSVDKGPFMGVYDSRFYQQPGLRPSAPNAQYPRAPFNSGIELPSGSGQEALLVNLPAANLEDPSGAINFLLGKVGSHLLQLELSAMQREGRGEIVSAPRVITSDQTEATISVGRRIPYITRDDGGNPQTQFEDAVLELKVLPHITPDDRIILGLNIKKDEPGEQIGDGLIINKRQVDTNVLVENGETIVLGGVFESARRTDRQQVPWLGDLPVIGNLFRTSARSEINRELLIFVTPRILRGELAVR